MKRIDWPCVSYWQSSRMVSRECVILFILGFVFGAILAYDIYIRRGEDDQ